MVTWTDARNAIRTRLRDLAGSYGWTVVHGNAPNQVIPTSFYVRFEIHGGASQQTTTGRTRRMRSAWLVTFDAWERIERGERNVQTAVDAVRVELQGTTEDGIRWGVPSLEELGTTATHFGLRVVLPVLFDETFTRDGSEPIGVLE